MALDQLWYDSLLLGLAEKSGLLVLGGDYSGVSKAPDISWQQEAK